MPVFEFTSPDGKTYEVEGPDGATEEQAFQMLQTQLGQATPPAPPAPPPQETPLQEIRRGVKSLPGDIANLGDMVLSLPAQGIGVGADIGMRGVAALRGIDSRIGGIMAQTFRNEVTDVLGNPLQKLMKAFGYGDNYDNSNIAQAMQSLMGQVEKGGAAVEKSTGGALTKEDVDSLLNTALYAIGGRATAGQLQPRLDKMGRVTQDTLPPLTAKQRAADTPKPQPRAPSTTAANLDALFGIRPQNERVAANKARRKEVKEAFADDPDLADYYAFKAGERARQSAAQEAEFAAAREAETARGRPWESQVDAPEFTTSRGATDLPIPEQWRPDTSRAEGLALGPDWTPPPAVPQPIRTPRTGSVEGRPLFREDVARPGARPEVPQTPALDSAVAKVKEGRSFELTAAEKIALRDLTSAHNKPDIIVPRSQRGAVDPEAHRNMVKFLQDLGFPAPDNLAKSMLSSVDDAKARVENNASGESAASLEAQSRLATEKAKGQTRLLVERDGTVRPLVGVDAVDQMAKPGQVILQKGVGRDEWTTLSKGADVGGAAEARAKGLAAQRGLADPDLLKKAGLTAAGAVVGSQVSDDPLLGSLIGAAAGAGTAWMTGSPAARKLAGEAAQGADYALGNVSTRIRNISEPLLHRARGYEQGVLQRTHQYLSRSDAFVEALSKIKGPGAESLARAIISNDAKAVKEALAATGDSVLGKEWANVRTLLDDVGQQLKASGRLDALRPDYFPRIVKDREGLISQLGGELKTQLQKDLNEARVKALRRGEELSPLEETLIINRSLQSRPIPGKPGFTKARVIDEVTKELQPFYAAPAESLHSYLSLAAKDLERAKFFGRDLVKTDGKVDVNASIGAVVNRLLQDGKITFLQADELGNILRSRFGPGEQSAAGLIQDAKNFANAGLLGNVVSAATQLGDVGTTVFAQGLRPTMEAVVRQVTGKQRVNMKDFGLADHISEEFVSTRKSAAFLNKVFKYSLFSGVDSFGKNVALEGALAKLQGQVRTVGGQRRLATKYADAFEGDFPALLRELQLREVGPQTRAALFSELSDIQPISRLEVPQAYLDMPNGRVLYMLKTFMLKQADIVRRTAYNEIKAGRTAEGVKNLTRYAIALGVSGATTDMIKDWLLGRELDFDKGDLAMNVMKTFGWTEYVADQAAKGNPIKAVGGSLAPPYKMFDDMLNASGAFERTERQQETDKTKLLNYVPVLGKVVESRYFDGAERFDEAKARREARKEREEAKQ